MVATSRTRNAVDRKVTWVRIPSFPPKQSARAAFFDGICVLCTPSLCEANPCTMADASLLNESHRFRQRKSTHSGAFILHQVFGVEAIKLGEDEAAVLADEHVVKVDFTATVFGSLTRTRARDTSASLPSASIRM